MQKVNLAEKLAMVDAPWTPKIVGELNDQHVKIAKLEGDFIWHRHTDEDELFLVLEGSLDIAFRDGQTHLEPGEFVIVPRGVEHKPSAPEGACVLFFEPATTLNTGDQHNERTVENLDRL